MAGDSIAANDGRFVTTDGVRYNIRTYHFSNDPGDFSPEINEDIPNFVDFDVETWRFIRSNSEQA